MRQNAAPRSPRACSREELREFERLVRRGFDGSDEGLPERIRRAHRLALHRSLEDELVGIAGLKAPTMPYRLAVFDRAGAGTSPTEFALELGWVYVVPDWRGRGLGELLCRGLLDGVLHTGVFATTRPGNTPMIRILTALGFEPDGEPYRHLRRDEDLVLFLRSEPSTG